MLQSPPFRFLFVCRQPQEIRGLERKLAARVGGGGSFQQRSIESFIIISPSHAMHVRTSCY